MKPHPKSSPFGALVLFALPLSLALGAEATSAQTLRNELWTTDGEVHAVAYWRNNIFLGGRFSHVGPATGGLIAFDATTGAANTPYFGVGGGEVHAVVPDGAGGYYIGGTFTVIEGQPRSGLAHLDGTGNLTPWQPLANGAVECIAVYGSTVYVGGSFTQITGQFRSHLAAIDSGSGAVNPWDPSPNGVVRALRVDASSGFLYAGGFFTSLVGGVRGLAAQFVASSGMLTPWDPHLANGSVQAIDVSAGRVFLGGTFVGQSGPLFAIVDQATGMNSIPPAITGGGGAGVSTIVVTRQSVSPFTETVWFGGYFDTVNGVTRRNLAAVANGTLTAFNPSPDNPVNAILVPTDSNGNATGVYVGGGFSLIGASQRSNLAALDSFGNASSWDPSPDNSVLALAPGAGEVVAGGGMTSARMVPRANFAVLDATSGTALPWTPGDANSDVYALTVLGNSLYVGGDFTKFGYQSRAAAFEMHLSDFSLTTWDPGLSCPSCRLTVDAISRPSSGNVIYLGGSFSSAHGQVRNNLVAVDTLGTVLPFDANVNGEVSCIALSERATAPFDVVTMYAGGTFSSVNGGVSRHNAAAFDPTTGQATLWNPVAPDTGQSVHALAFSNASGSGTIFIGGDFNLSGPTPSYGLAAVDTTGAMKWPLGADGAALAFMERGGLVYVGGGFSTVAGQTRTLLACIDDTSGTLTGWSPQMGAPGAAVEALAQSGVTIYGGGSFGIAVGYPRQSFVGFADGVLTSVESQPIPGRSITLRAAPNPFVETTAFRLYASRDEAVTVGVYDPAGRLVRRLRQGVLAAGEHVLKWNGQNDAGRLAARGIYFVRVHGRTIDSRTKVLFLR